VTRRDANEQGAMEECAVANTFEEQAKERFRKSLAFLQKANALLQDDLIFRSALADSVSATKNMLQGYLLLRIAANPTSAVTQRWQEATIGGRMPDLIRACGEAGLNLHGLDRDIQRLNNERNYRAHDDPQRFVDPAQAEKAYELAITVQRRIKAAVQGREVEVIGIAPPAARSASSRLSGPVRAAVSSTLDKVAAATRANGAVAVTTAPVAASASAGRSGSDSASSSASGSSNGKASPPASQTDASDDDEPATEDTYAEMPALSRRGASGGGSRVVRVALLVAALIIGIVAGFGLSIPVANGAAPSFLGFAKGFYTAPVATSALTPTATVVPTATPQTAPVVLGALTADQPVCAASALQVTLVNTGSAAVQYAVGATSPSATISVGTAASQSAHFATLAANTNVTLTVNGLSAKDGIVIVTSAGSVQLSARAC
jgi:hypothetical protein